MEIRNAKVQDLPRIMEIYEEAKSFMKESGNPTQWVDGYPQEELLRSDIANENLYVCVENDHVVGVFAFIIGEDPTYKIIKNGTWHYSGLYGTIHRIASDGSVRGLADQCFRFCLKKCSQLRIDTHEDNKPMQNAILRFGFQRCGIIYIADGTPRIAFDYQED